MKNILSIPTLTSTANKIILLTLLTFGTALLQAQINLVQNPGFTNGTQSWSTTCSIEINPETVYGGTDASNKVSEIDIERCLHQDISIVPGVQYNFSFKAARRQSGTPATVGLTVKITGLQSGTQYVNANKTYTQTSWYYITENFSFIIPADATDTKVRISFTNYKTTGTYGALIDDIFFERDPLFGMLPIQLVQFRGNVQNGYAQVTWIADNRDKDGDYFVIERSAAGQNKFDAIDRVELNAGSNRYAYTDKILLKGIYQYRLKAVNQDGSFTYSKIVSLGGSTNSFSVYPNPAIHTLRYTLHIPAAATINVQIYNLSGSIVLNRRMPLQAGDNTVSLDISSLPKGSFYLKVSDAEGNNHVKAIRKG